MFDDGAYPGKMFCWLHKPLQLMEPQCIELLVSKGRQSRQGFLSSFNLAMPIYRKTELEINPFR